MSLSSNKSDDSNEADCEEVHLRNKPAHLAERSSVNQCINELSSNLAVEAARRRCNSEVVQRTDIDADSNGIVDLYIFQYTYEFVFYNTMRCVKQHFLI